MADEKCERIQGCGYFRKYGVSERVACRGFITAYCEGKLQNQCRRKSFLKEHGHAPPDEMLPTGLFLED